MPEGPNADDARNTVKLRAESQAVTARAWAERYRRRAEAIIKDLETDQLTSDSAAVAAAWALAARYQAAAHAAWTQADEFDVEAAQVAATGST